MDPALLLQRQGAATAAAAGCAPTLKKLLHLRAIFETPLLHVFGFPFILRHQLSAAACCACCSSCCCCWCFPPAAAAADAATHPTISSSSTTAAVAAAAGRAEEGTAFGVYNGDSVPPPVASIDAAFTRSCASMIPCSAARLCSCCKGTNADSGHAAAQRRHSSSSSSSRSSSSSSSSSSSTSSSGSSSSSSSSRSGRPYEQTGDSTRAVRGNRKRLRLVGEDTVAAVVASAISKHKHMRSTRPQDERAVEIFISGNVLRQVKLPIDAGSYVLFFTADWLQYLARYIRTAQQEAVLLLNQSHCCPTCGNGGGSNNDSSLGDSNTGSSSSSSNRSESSSCCCNSITFAHVTDRKTSSRCGCCVQPAKSAGNNNSSGFLRSRRRSLTAGYMSPRTSGSGCDECCSSRCVDDAHETTNAAPLRFTPVLRQDEVQTDNECQRCCSIANDASRSRKKVLLSLPGMLAQQLKDTLQLQLLNVHTQTQIDKQVVEDVLGNYLRAWYQRRHDTVVYLRELLQRYEELLQEVNLEQTARSEIKSQQPHQKPGSNKGMMMKSKEITHTQGPSSYAAARRNEEGRRSQDEQSSNTVLKVVEIGHSVKVKREATQISRDAEDAGRKTTRNSDSNAEDKEPSASHIKHGRGRIGNCSNHFFKNETGSATTVYTCSMRQQQVTSENKSQAELETEDTTQSQGTQQQQRCMMNAGKCTALMKELVKFHYLLQRGCEAAAEVFSLEERVAAADVASRTDDSTLLEKPKTELHGEEAGGADDARTKGWNRHSERQEKEHQGKFVITVKEEKDEEGGVGTKNKKTTTGKEREQSCRRGSRDGVEESRQPWSSTTHTTTNMASLEKKIRWAAAAVQLLTEGEKKLLCGHTPQVGLPRVAQVKKCGSHNSSVGASSGLTCATVSAAPSPRVAPAAAHTSRDCGYRTNTWPQHQTLLKAGRVEKGGGKNPHHEEAKQQPLVNFESLLQRQVEEILLLLYEAPLLHNRAGSNAVSLAVPQQGLLVRWLRDGRKEVLSSIKRRRFKELLWVDIERRGLLKSGLGSRMTLLDLKGIGGAETTETAAGEVVRAAERAEQYM